MHILSGGRLRMRRSVYIPDAAPGETIDLPVSCYLLRHAQGNVLFDTGCHPAIAEDAASRWGGLAKAMVPIMAPGDHVLAGLAEIGLSPADIDVVVNSHLHSDHCGCNEFFTRATMVVHTAELAAAAAPESLGQGYFEADWRQPMAVDAFEGARDLFGDGRIRLLPLPGHTAGTISLLASFDRDGRFLIASDTVTVRETLDREFIPRVNWSADALLKSLAEIRRIEAEGATVLCGHDVRQWATLKKGADAYQ